jgi:hypothetical protein
LESAFGGLTPPAADELVVDLPGDAERATIREKFGGRHWREIQVHEIITEPDILSFLTHVGYQFLLPAVLRATLIDPKGADILCDHILWSIADSGLDESWQQRKAAYLATGAKMGMSAEVIASLAPRHDAKAALEELRKRRLRQLTADQKICLRGYIEFLRRHHHEEYVANDLDRAAERLDRELNLA